MKSIYMEMTISGALNHDHVSGSNRAKLEAKLKKELRPKWEKELRDAAYECGLDLREFSPITMLDLEVL